MGQTSAKTQQIDHDTQPQSAKPTFDSNPGVDICFMMDCTGSMGSYIKMAQNKIKDIMRQIKELYPKSEIRISIVGYRDHCDRNRFEVQPFTTSADQAKKFLDGLYADGGGDTPEDINGAFQKCLYTLDWQNPVRIAILIADAPCHGKGYHNCNDSYPNGHKEDKPWDQIFKDLVEKRIDFLFLKITDYTDIMFRKFKEHAEKAGANEAEISFTQELANQNSNLVAEGKTKAKAEDHFAATITEKIEASLKKGLAKKLEKRREENANLMNDIKAKIKEIVQQIDFEALRAKHGELAAKVGECILSSNDFIDAIADEDCLCLTFDIGRSQAAIVDPTQIIIKNVYPSFLTAGSFFYSTEFALKKNKLAHGGYEKHAEGLILKGAASENITGVMPLYFCEENWPIAKLLMKLTIAWDVTLDPLGYVYTQIKTVPFLILAKLAEMLYEKPESEFLKFQFDLVKRTCIQIMNDGSKPEFENKFNKEVYDLYMKYVEDPSIRTIDSIASNAVFLAQLYIAFESGAFSSRGEEYFDALFQAMLEEELRRKEYGIPEGFDTTQWMFKLLNIDVENHISKPVDEFIHSQSKTKTGQASEFEQKFLQIMNAVKSDASDKIKEEVKSEIKEDSDKIVKGDPRSKEPIVYNYEFKTKGEYNEAQNKAFKEYNETLKIVMKYLYPLRMLFTNKKVENPNNFKDWGIDNDFQFFTLYIQNKLHHKNASRREAFTNKTYMDPWTQSKEFVQYWYNKLVEDEKSSRINKYLTSLRETKSAYQANIFMSTDNLNEAAGALLGVCIGVNVMDYFKSLCLGGSLHTGEKLKMLVTGHYKGVRLFSDAISWTPSRRTSNMILRAHPKLFTPEEWVAILPKLSLGYAKMIAGN